MGYCFRLANCQLILNNQMIDIIPSTSFKLVHNTCLPRIHPHKPYPYALWCWHIYQYLPKETPNDVGEVIPAP